MEKRKMFLHSLIFFNKHLQIILSAKNIYVNPSRLNILSTWSLESNGARTVTVNKKSIGYIWRWWVEREKKGAEQGVGECVMECGFGRWYLSEHLKVVKEFILWASGRNSLGWENVLSIGFKMWYELYKQWGQLTGEKTGRKVGFEPWE